MGLPSVESVFWLGLKARRQRKWTEKAKAMSEVRGKPSLQLGLELQLQQAGCPFRAQAILLFISANHGVLWCAG